MILSILTLGYNIRFETFEAIFSNNFKPLPVTTSQREATFLNPFACRGKNFRKKVRTLFSCRQEETIGAEHAESSFIVVHGRFRSGSALEAENFLSLIVRH